VADQIDLDEAGSGLVPLRPGPNGDLRSDPGLGVALATEPGQDLGPPEPPVDGGRAHLHEQRRLLTAGIELAVSAQQLDQDPQHGGEALAGWSPPGPPAQLEG